MISFSAYVKNETSILRCTYERFVFSAIKGLIFDAALRNEYCITSSTWMEKKSIHAINSSSSHPLLKVVSFAGHSAAFRALFKSLVLILIQTDGKGPKKCRRSIIYEIVN